MRTKLLALLKSPWFWFWFLIVALIAGAVIAGYSGNGVLVFLLLMLAVLTVALVFAAIWVANEKKSKRKMSAAEAAHMVSHGPILAGGRRERD